VETVHHETGLGRFELMSRAPDPLLRPYVRGYHGYSERTSRPLRRRELPSGDVILVLDLGAGVRLLEPRRALHTSFVAGLDEQSAVTEHDGRADGVQVSFTPLGAHRFLGVPMHTLSHCVVELDDLLGASANELADRLRDAPGWEARLDVLDSVVRARLSRGTEPTSEVAWAWRRLVATAGRVRVGDLARELGWSRKRLAARFREQIGLPAKACARILRFRRAVRLLERDDVTRFTEIALDCGYFDQAHLNRDFRRFAGSTPSEFLARRIADGFGVRPE
jgi:AraC-like DNA-binding protein